MARPRPSSTPMASPRSERLQRGTSDRSIKGLGLSRSCLATPFRVPVGDLPGVPRWAHSAVLPLVWSSTLAYRRLVQLTQPPVWKRGDRTHAADLLAPEIGLLRGPQILSILSPRPIDHHPYVRCRCGHGAYRLVAAGDPPHWGCSACLRLKATKWPWTITEILLAEYLCGLRIGLTGRDLCKRRARLLQRLQERHLRHGHTPQDLVLLAVGGALLKRKPLHDRRGWGRRPGGEIREKIIRSGPLWDRLFPQLVPAMIDQLLHPDAFLRRFACH